MTAPTVEAASTGVTPRPPLVPEGPPLDTERLARYARHLTLPGVGVSGQRRLAAARILVIGAGGLGSPALLYLAAAGVGTLGVIDDDVVDESNLQRQVIHARADVGRPKVESARDAVLAANPDVAVELHPVRLTAANALEIVRQYDLVVDGSDNFATRYLVSDATTLAGIPHVWGALDRFRGQVAVFWSAPPPGHPPVTYRDVFPEAPPPGTVPSCAEGGVLGALCATIGSVMVTEAVKLVTGAGRSLLGRLALYDAADVTWRELRVLPDPTRPPVTRVEEPAPEVCEVPAPGAAPTTGGEVSATELRDLLDSPTPPFLLDVREEFERDIVAIPGAVLVPSGRFQGPGAADAVAALPQDRPVAVYCKAGGRSQRVVDALRAAGRHDVLQVTGGVLAWVRDVDPSLPRY
ncbi:UBA/THIF-type NAD/FAD binding protein [Cellulomonas flavigena DSM 20109]|uniref:UBA/THIF-type NAD/FAD binding protein n=1 Tax=Cellulomonas flavigena (strain ATCC 482 / DSM 20109 / BCRC 11376 / JCM 18109 / NBRC 3775 / NCIMB 8073 / NRS 134) TaxID=446466 RepID=D5UHY2_CELFN|nr:ThiF family adenylyltransferase [Cellulomonas flavigena]ADG73406.1 UBA/THIF-type NAD/FAD binding protein [Cellulomonas flavigena DSM 20109]